METINDDNYKIKITLKSDSLYHSGHLIFCSGYSISTFGVNLSNRASLINGQSIVYAFATMYDTINIIDFNKTGKV